MDFSWILTFLVGLVTWFLVKFYLKIRHLPPGPFPLPVVGNLLNFKKKKLFDVIQQYRKEHGDVFTVWLGQLPIVFVCGLPQVKEAMLERRNDFAGRGNFRSLEIFLDGNSNIGDTDFGKPWETLRKMAHTAIRKYAASDELPPLIEQITQEIIDKMVQEKEPFDPKEHIYLLISNIIASSILGKKFKSDDPEFLKFREVTDSLNEALGSGFMADFLPFLGFFYKHQEQQLRKAAEIGIPLLLKKLQQHRATFEKDVIRDMMDSILSAREESIAEGKESAVHMNDTNLAYSIFDLYFAGIETTQITIRWTLLFLATYQDMQKKLREELQDRIGDRMPVQEDKKFCPYTMSVIHETLRCRAAAPIGLPHRATCDSQIGGYPIAKGINVIMYLDMVHKSQDNWDEPEKFKPERFLDAEGNFTEARLSQYMPFGQGRRNCIGEKLAIAEMFMVLVGIVRKCQINLKEAPVDMNPNQDDILFSIPHQYKITVTPI